MKKWFIYFLLCTYLTSFSEVRQLVKMPRLVEHFISHKMANHDMSIYAFIKMHYIDEHIVDSDYKQDMKLPFKTHDFSHSIVNLNIPPESPSLNILQQSIYVDRSTHFSYSEKYYPSVFSKIWEPPKI
ncbi:hypothetical protein [Kaistella carnis]|uniref:Uncharacterized protein n=1 Tax=Kaistella carnis TaxID=1241979 RepID=A0A3G8XJR5_9FLAO|nr:hypothetical protein [Kaistella carnis]AZI31997.1 hypothetical protein EIB73_01860 [Kaistella carnis]